MLRLIIICVLFSLTMSGCGSKADGICPYSIMVNGQIYHTYEEVVETSDVEVLGYINSCVDITQLPKEDNQSNFPDSLEQPYGIMDGRMVIYYLDNWHKCYLPEEIDSNDEE